MTMSALPSDYDPTKVNSLDSFHPSVVVLLTFCLSFSIKVQMILRDVPHHQREFALISDFIHLQSTRYVYGGDSVSKLVTSYYLCFCNHQYHRVASRAASYACKRVLKISNSNRIPLLHDVASAHIRDPHTYPLDLMMYASSIDSLQHIVKSGGVEDLNHFTSSLHEADDVFIRERKSNRIIMHRNERNSFTWRVLLCVVCFHHD
jgi:hypothetical protein